MKRNFHGTGVRFLILAAIAVLLLCGIACAEVISSDGFTVENGVLVAYTGTDAEVVIPGDLNITKIGDEAFRDNTSITSVVIPEGITEIGNNAFRKCGKLSDVRLPAGLTAIGEAAFAECFKIMEISLPDGLAVIGHSAFSATGIETIAVPESLTTVGKYAFNDAPITCSLNTAGRVLSKVGYKKLVSADAPDFVVRVCFTETDEAYVVIDRYTGSAAQATVPAAMDGLPVREIGDNCFWNCDGLTGVILPESLVRIGEYTFYSCDKLAEVVLPNGLTSIGYKAFPNCAGLESINLPMGLESIGTYSFLNCSSLTAKVYPNTVGHAYCVDNGIQYETPDGFVVKNKVLVAYKGTDTNIEVPGNMGITAIGDSAFEECEDIVSIRLGEGITEIGNSAFRWCDSLESVELPDGLTDIGDMAFYNCVSLESIAIPDSITSVGSSIFSPGTKVFCNLNGAGLVLANMGYGRLISPSAQDFRINFVFVADEPQLIIAEYLGNAAQVSIPASIDGLPVCEIGMSAFENNRSLVSVSLPEGLKSTGDCAFSGCSSLENVSLPKGLESISYASFENCDSLVSISLPKGVISIENSAFAYCYKLASVDLPRGLDSIGNSAFAYCHSLTDIELPKGLTTIRDAAFWDCNNLGDVVLPDGLVSVGSSAFVSIENMETITVPDSVKTVGNDAFISAKSLICNLNGAGLLLADAKYTNLVSAGMPDFRVEIHYDEENEAYLAINAYRADAAETSVPDAIDTLPVRKICNLAFHDRDDLRKIILPEGLTDIGSSAFQSCGALESVILPESLVSIGMDAFNACDQLTAEVYYSTVGHTYCKENGIPHAITADNWTLRDGVLTITGTATVIPDDISYASITVNKGAALDFDATAEISVPVINEGTITNAKFVEGASISGNGSAVVLHSLNGEDTLLSCGAAMPAPERGWRWYIGEDKLADDAVVPLLYTEFTKKIEFAIADDVLTAYKGTDTNIVIPDNLGITAIGDDAFSGKTAITSVVVPEGVLSIGMGAFRDCRKLEQISLPESLTYIGSSAFRDCASLNGITVPAAVREIGSAAFEGCTGLINAGLSEGLERMGHSAFRSCTGLTAVVLPDSLAEIGSDAFRDCTALKSIIVPGTDMPLLGTGVFEDTALVNVYCGALSDADFWAAELGCNSIYPEDISAPVCVVLPMDARMAVGEQKQIAPAIIPAGDSLALEWTSSAPEIVSVENGLLTARAMGEAVITAVLGDISDTMRVEIYSRAEDFSLSADEIWLESKTGMQLEILDIRPEGAEDTFVWKTSDKTICTVDADGRIFARLPGEAVVSAESITGISRECRVHVCAAVTAVEFEETEAVILCGNHFRLKARVTAGEQELVNQLVTFESSDEAVATVDETGKVTARAAGTAVITAAAGSGVSAKCAVTVREPETLVLPASMKQIESEAFADIAAEAVRLPDGCESIGEQAFANSPKLQQVYMPDSVSDIAETAFDGCGQVRFICESENKAAEYAETNGIEWEIF